MSSADSLTSVIEMQEEYCVRIKWKTILTQTGGAVARENKLIEELSAPRGLVVRPAAESMIRLNMHSFSSDSLQKDDLCVKQHPPDRSSKINILTVTDRKTKTDVFFFFFEARHRETGTFTSWQKSQGRQWTLSSGSAVSRSHVFLNRKVGEIVCGHTRHFLFSWKADSTPGSVPAADKSSGSWHDAVAWSATAASKPVTRQLLIWE